VPASISFCQAFCLAFPCLSWNGEKSVKSGFGERLGRRVYGDLCVVGMGSRNSLGKRGWRLEQACVCFSGALWENGWVGSYLQIKHAGSRGFGDVFAFGDFEEGVELEIYSQLIEDPQVVLDIFLVGEGRIWHVVPLATHRCWALR
jgi:hypothetical protein